MYLPEILCLLEIFKKIRPFKTVVAYLGYTGLKNLGDEALADAIQKMLLPISVVKHPRFSGIGQGISKFLDNKIYRAMLLGAGTLVNSRDYLYVLQKYQTMGLPTFVFGTGVLDPDFYDSNPNFPNCMNKWVEALDKCKSVYVRGPLSIEILNNYGFKKAVICGDPALYFCDEKIHEKQNKKIIGINVGTTWHGKTLWGGSDQKVYDFVLSLCRVLLSLDYKVIIYSVAECDNQTCFSIASQFPHQVKAVAATYNAEEFKRKIRSVDLFIGEKLHGVILALCTNTPSIMLAYTPKCYDFMRSLDMEQYCIRTDRLDVDKIIGLLEMFSSDLPSFQGAIFKKTHQYKKLLDETSRLIYDQIVSISK